MEKRGVKYVERETEEKMGFDEEDEFKSQDESADAEVITKMKKKMMH